MRYASHIRIKHLKLLHLLILVLSGGSVFKVTWRVLIYNKQGIRPHKGIQFMMNNLVC